MALTWEKTAEEKFKLLVERIPIFMRSMAEDMIRQKAESIVRDAQRSEITEKDMVDAFFAETPFGFHGPMKSDMDAVGVDYTKYGHAK